MQRFLTPKEVAALLRVSKFTVYDWLKRGHLQGWRAGARGSWRIAEDEVEDFIRRSHENRDAYE